VSLLNEPKVTRWPSDAIPPSEKEMSEALLSEGWSPFRMVEPPCTRYHTTIKYDLEIRWVIGGRLVIGTSKRNYILESGDRIELPRGTHHWVKVLSENGSAYFMAARHYIQ
jgi:ethanolamine utilization protein EutQ (cupin superfamily)